MSDRSDLEHALSDLEHALNALGRSVAAALHLEDIARWMSRQPALIWLLVIVIGSFFLGAYVGKWYL